MKSARKLIVTLYNS